MKALPVLAAAALLGTATVAPALAGPLSPSAIRHVRDVGGAWAPTKTQGLNLVNAVDLGAISPNAIVHVAVSLQPNTAAMNQALMAIYTPGSANYHHFISPAQFNATMAPTQAQAAAVVSYLQSSGFSQISVTPNRMLVVATATASTVQNAFNTSIHTFRQNGVGVYANVTPALVPASLGGTVLAVLGLNNIQAHTNARAARPAIQSFVRSHYAHGANVLRAARSLQGHGRQAQSVAGGTAAPSGSVATGNGASCFSGVTVQGDCMLAGITPVGLGQAYDNLAFPWWQAPLPVSVANLTEASISQTIADLRQMEAESGLPQIPVTVINTSPYSSADTSGVPEWDIDTQSMQGVFLNAKQIILYNGYALDDFDTAQQFNRFVTDDIAINMNASEGECEVFAYQSGSMHTIDNIFFQAALQGQSVFVSSGDEGSACAVAANTGTPAGVPSVEYPSSSPFAVSVGGTSMYLDTAGNYQGETSWIGGGGGLSYFEISNPFQKATIPSQTTRSLPDVALEADPNQGGIIAVVNGAHSQYGGTSLASPLAMAAWAELQATHNSGLGHAQLALYNLYNKYGYNTEPGPTPGPSNTLIPIQNLLGFRDIIVGSNGLYQALPGYDFTTGLGSLDIYKLGQMIDGSV